MPETVKLEVDVDKRVATIRLDRPPMNAIDSGLLSDLAAVTDEVAANEQVRAVVLWGGPKIFAAGADVKEFPDFDHERAKQVSTQIGTTIAAFENLPQITIACVNGYALGGGFEVALGAEFRVVGDDAVLGLPEVLLGVIPGGGGTQRLTQLVGITKAKELIYTGAMVKAQEAVSMGLASSVHPADAAYDAAVDQAARYAKGPASLQMAKAAIMAGLSLPLDEALKIETEEFAKCFATEDCAVGVRSFLDHGPGKAEFTGR